MNIIDKLLDENNNDVIILYNDEGNPVRFSQIAVVYCNDEPYFILSIIDENTGEHDDEGIVFKIVEQDNGEELLVVEENDEVIDDVFDEYEKLIEENKK